MAARARKTRAKKPSSPTTQETSVVEISVRSGQRAVTTVEGAALERYDFYGGSFRQVSALLGPIVVQEDLSKRACHMLLVLAGKQERKGAVHLNQQQMAELMISERRPKGWSRVEVNQVLKELREAGLLFKVKRGHYAFDPQAIFHGTATEQKTAIADMPAEFPSVQVPGEQRGGPNE